MEEMTIPAIRSDEDWLEMREGEPGAIRGRLYARLDPGAKGLMVSNTSWELIAVTLSTPYDGPPIDAGAEVDIVARRTEDGLETASSDITIKREN